MICMPEGGQRKGLLSRSSDVMPDAVKIGWLNLLPALYPMKIRRCHSGKKPRLRYSVSCSAYGQGAVIGKLAFGKFVDYYNFENYFRIGELNDNELLCLASFLYHKECYLILMIMLDRYKKRFVFATSSLLRKFEADGALMKRFSRIGFLTDREKAG